MRTSLKILITMIVILGFGFTLFSGKDFHSAAKGDRELFSSPPDATKGPEYMKGSVTIKLKSGLGDFSRQEGMVQSGIKSLDDKFAIYQVNKIDKRFIYNPSRLKAGLPDLSRIYEISFPDHFSAIEVAEAFSADPNIEYAEPIPVYNYFDVPNDFLYNQMQHLPQIHAPDAWNISKGENGNQDVVIAIIDSGVDWKHEDLQGNIWQNLAEDADGDGHTMEFNGTAWVLDPGDLNGVDNDGNSHIDDLIGWNFPGNNNNPAPYPSNPWFFHGTHCAGLAAGVTNNTSGIASISWNVHVMPVCIDQNGSNPYGINGILYAAENGADIISCSWGGNVYSAADQDAINYASGLGSIIVAAASNQKSTVKVYPADYHNVISVTSVSADDSKAWYANYNSFIDISAPGGDNVNEILSTWPGGTYEGLMGTSMATPLTAGCFGLLKSYHPDWSNSQLITQVLGTADNIDSINPDYASMLGSGRINAYRMLSEQNVTPFLELELLSVSTSDQNGNGINEPGENVTLNFNFYNHMQASGSQNVNVTLSTSDPDISILTGTCTSTAVPDNSFSMQNQLQVNISSDATCHFADLHLHVSAAVPIMTGQDTDFKLLVNPSGILVYEGQEEGKEYSGSFIGDALGRLGYDYTYSNTLTTLLGFQTAFLSFGNYNQPLDQSTPFTQDQSLAIQQFLEQGGNLYLEMGGMFYRINNSGFSNLQSMKDLFGINLVAYQNGDNPLDTLLGAPGSPMQNMSFTISDQVHYSHIDKLYPKPAASSVFTETGYPSVGVMYNGSLSHNQKTFYLGYSLADLHDRDTTSSRYMVLLKTLKFFNFTLPQGYLLSNFTADKTAGAVPLQVHFKDISLWDPQHPASSWQWDFNNDGTVDSYEQDPVWTYSEAGLFDVKLVASNGVRSDTLVQKALISANAGYLVYEGVPDGNEYSGSFIRDFMQGLGLYVDYRNTLPESLEGFSAVFLSFGNVGTGSTFLNDRMANTITDYLQKGGYVYLDGADALGSDQSSNTQLHSLFGLAQTHDGSTNRIDDLEGQPDALTHDMAFTGISQVSDVFIDYFDPAPNNSVAAFIESDYGTVAVQSEIQGGRRTFCFSYSLAYLDDDQYPNTRDELMRRLLEFFDIQTAVTDGGQEAADGFALYPNPFLDNISVSAKGNDPVNGTLAIYDLDARQVLEQRLTGPSAVINVSGLPPGVYVVRIENQGKRQITKVIRQ